MPEQHSCPDRAVSTALTGLGHHGRVRPRDRGRRRDRQDDIVVRDGEGGRSRRLPSTPSASRRERGEATCSRTGHALRVYQPRQGCSSLLSYFPHSATVHAPTRPRRAWSTPENARACWQALSSLFESASEAPSLGVAWAPSVAAPHCNGLNYVESWRRVTAPRAAPCSRRSPTVRSRSRRTADALQASVVNLTSLPRLLLLRGAARTPVASGGVPDDELARWHARDHGGSHVGSSAASCQTPAALSSRKSQRPFALARLRRRHDQPRTVGPSEAARHEGARSRTTQRPSAPLSVAPSASFSTKTSLPPHVVLTRYSIPVPGSPKLGGRESSRPGREPSLADFGAFSVRFFDSPPVPSRRRALAQETRLQTRRGEGRSALDRPRAVGASQPAEHTAADAHRGERRSRRVRPRSRRTSDRRAAGLKPSLTRPSDVAIWRKGDTRCLQVGTRIS